MRWRRCFVSRNYILVALAKSLFLLLRCFASKLFGRYFLFYSLVIVTRQNIVTAADKCVCACCNVDTWRNITINSKKRTKNAKRWKALKGNVRSKLSKHRQQWMNIWVYGRAQWVPSEYYTSWPPTTHCSTDGKKIMSSNLLCSCQCHCPSCSSNGITSYRFGVLPF